MLLGSTTANRFPNIMLQSFMIRELSVGFYKNATP
jgi:hypothetical protein